MARTTFSIEDLKTPEGLERILRQFELAMQSLEAPTLPPVVRQAAGGLANAKAGVGDIAGAGGGGSVADVTIPEAPVVGVIYKQAQNSSFRYHVSIGVDIPTAPAPSNWNFISLTRVQVASDSGFALLNGGAIFDQSFKSPPPLLVPFSTNYPGTYYIRGRVTNAFGNSAWTTITLTTDRLDGLTDDTDLMAGPSVSAVVKNGATNNFLSGTEVFVSFEVPVLNSATYQGYTILAHDSSTLPTATTVETGTAGAISAGVPVLTDATKAWGLNVWAGKDLVVFSDKRSGVPSYDYEGQIVMANIVSNTATTITFNAKSQVIDRTVTGVKFYIVNHGVGAHFWEKLKYCSGWITDVSLTGGPTLDQSGRVRSDRFPTGFNPIYTWVLLYNCYGAGRVTASPPNVTALGIVSDEIKNLNITTTKIADDAITTPKLLALNVTAAKIEAWTITAGMLSAGTVTAGTFIGTVFKTGTSGSRIEIDSTNGIRAYDAGGVVQTQIPLSGFPGQVNTRTIVGYSDSLFLQSHDARQSIAIHDASFLDAIYFVTGTSLRMLLSTTGLELQTGISLRVVSGQGAATSAGTGHAYDNTGGTGVIGYHNGTEVFRANTGGTKVNISGTYYTLTRDASGFVKA